jgi:hypothetical protein
MRWPRLVRGTKEKGTALPVAQQRRQQAYTDLLQKFETP